jgi:ribonuclease T1
LLRGILVRSNWFKLVLTGFLLAAMLGFAGIGAKTAFDSPELGGIAFSALPTQGQDTHRLIYQGGPFPFDKDGVVFGNRERFLPQHKRGYYREYTVRTPGSRDRGARRIICGGQATQPDDCYYTADHYASFRKIVP